MDDTQSQPPAAWWAELDALRNDLDQLRRDVGADSTMTDGLAEIDSLRITELEEIAAARWPRRILVRWRLGRDLRRSVAHIELDTFTSKRTETVHTGWMEQDARPGTRRAAPYPGPPFKKPGRHR